MALNVQGGNRAVQLGTQAVELGIVNQRVLDHICSGTVSEADVAAAKLGMIRAGMQGIVKIDDPAKLSTAQQAKLETAQQFFKALCETFPQAAANAEFMDARWLAVLTRPPRPTEDFVWNQPILPRPTVLQEDFHPTTGDAQHQKMAAFSNDGVFSGAINPQDTSTLTQKEVSWTGQCQEKAATGTESPSPRDWLWTDGPRSELTRPNRQPQTGREWGGRSQEWARAALQGKDPGPRLDEILEQAGVSKTGKK